MNTIRVRMFGYSITIAKPTKCPTCKENIDANILERVIDNTDGNVQYIIIYKCPQCGDIFLAKYNIGKELELKEIEKQSKLVRLCQK